MSECAIWPGFVGAVLAAAGDAGRAGHGAGAERRQLPREAGAHHRAVRAGRADRRGRAADRAEALGAARQAVLHRQRRRRRRQQRHGAGGAGRRRTATRSCSCPRASSSIRASIRRFPTTPSRTSRRSPSPATRRTRCWSIRRCRRRPSRELIDYIKNNPGKVSYGSAGTGTTPHLSGELFRLTLKLDIVHVPFSGAGPAIQALAGDHTPMAFTSLPPAIPLINEGKIRPLAVVRGKARGGAPQRADAGRGRPAGPGGRHHAGGAGAGGNAAADRRPALPRDQGDRRAARHQGALRDARPRRRSPIRRRSLPRRSRSRSRSGARSSAAPTSRWSERLQRDACAERLEGEPTSPSSPGLTRRSR